MKRGWDTDKHPGPGLWFLNEDGTVSAYDRVDRLVIVSDDGSALFVTLDFNKWNVDAAPARATDFDISTPEKPS